MSMPMSSPQPHSAESPVPAKPTLTPREWEIAQLVARGHSNAAIANELGLRIQTVKNHLSIVYTKLGISSRTQLAIRVLGPGL
jgi:DNA-binding NarL/FixJ family response regulator